MHVAVLFEYPTLHGGERSLLAVIDELQRRRREIRFTAIAAETGALAEALFTRGIAHRPWSVRDERNERRPSAEFEQSLTAILDELRPDLVHANSLSMGRVLGRLRPQLDLPATGHLRDIIKLSSAAIGELNRLDRVIAVSGATKQFHVGQGLDAERVAVIHNGIDLQEFAPRPATGFLQRELELPPEVRLIAAIGQIGLRKGWDVLAEAAPADETVHLVLIGERFSEKEESQRYEANLRRQFEHGAWAKRVHWLGTRGDVSRILNEIDLLVHPAKQEPLGRVLLEALASGVPIAATDVGGTREIIEPEICGRLLPQSCPAQLQAAISDLLSDRKLSDRFRAAARRRAENNFDICGAAAKPLSLWQSLVD